MGNDGRAALGGGVADGRGGSGAALVGLAYGVSGEIGHAVLSLQEGAAALRDLDTRTLVVGAQEPQIPLQHSRRQLAHRVQHSNAHHSYKPRERRGDEVESVVKVRS